VAAILDAARDRAHPARDHCLAPSRTAAAGSDGHRYTRMFPELPHLAGDSSLLRAIGRAGGACDPVHASRAEARLVAAGWPVFGQYIAHDITADRSPVTHHDDETMVRNIRSARLNLEALYGEGPVGNPYLYQRDDPAKLLLGAESNDVPRNQEGTALVGDPRQDVHLLISQMQVAMIKAHNRLVDRLREDGIADADLYEEARRALTWHYQWLALFDFLPVVMGEDRARALLTDGPRFFKPGGRVSIPFEFADAAYRYGHCQMRQTYRVQPGGEEWRLFPDLVGFRPVTSDRVLDWSMFFDVAGRPAAQRARPIDGCLPESLLALPTVITGALDDQDLESLAVRDLQRGVATGLPSGEAVARAAGENPLRADEVGLARYGWAGETPLWYYVVKEAECREEGERLGPVGSLVVGEVLLGIVDGDPESFRAVDPSWHPTLPGRRTGRFEISDLLLPV
jgi:Animal haem peroxidase